MDETVLSLEDVYLTLSGNAGAINIINGISLKVNENTTLGITGPSGSGKSSLLMLMAGLEKTSAGRIRAMGEDITAMSEDELARFRLKHVGVVFQSFHLIPTMTALENVAVPLELAEYSKAYDLAEEELALVGLDERFNHYPSQLSGGEQQRVALARASVRKPDILFADEPTGNLDAANGAKVFDLLFGLQKKRGATLVVVTHSKELATRCNRIIQLQDGRIKTAS